MGHFTAYELGMNSACKMIAFYEILQTDVDRKMSTFRSLEKQPLDTNGRILIMLNLVREKQYERAWAGLNCFRLGCITRPL
jgi:hypothetical protein